MAGATELSNYSPEIVTLIDAANLASVDLSAQQPTIWQNTLDAARFLTTLAHQGEDGQGNFNRELSLVAAGEVDHVSDPLVPFTEQVGGYPVGRWTSVFEAIHKINLVVGQLEEAQADNIGFYVQRQGAAMAQLFKLPAIDRMDPSATFNHWLGESLNYAYLVGVAEHSTNREKEEALWELAEQANIDILGSRGRALTLKLAQLIESSLYD